MQVLSLCRASGRLEAAVVSAQTELASGFIIITITVFLSLFISPLYSPITDPSRKTCIRL